MVYNLGGPICLDIGFIGPSSGYYAVVSLILTQVSLFLFEKHLTRHSIERRGRARGLGGGRGHLPSV